MLVTMTVRYMNRLYAPVVQKVLQDSQGKEPHLWRMLSTSIGPRLNKKCGCDSPGTCRVLLNCGQVLQCLIVQCTLRGVGCNENRLDELLKVRHE